MVKVTSVISEYLNEWYTKTASKIPMQGNLPGGRSFYKFKSCQRLKQGKKPTVTTPYGCKSPTMPSVKSINTNSTAAYQQNS